MHAVILAAGFGSRMSLSPFCPKPLLPLGQGCVLDHVVTSVWVPGITAIQVVHNDAVVVTDVPDARGIPRRKTADWAVEFKRWSKSLKWAPEVGRNHDTPYIRLRNNGVAEEKDRRGSVGDLAFAISKMSVDKMDRGLLVATADNLFSHPRLSRLAGETSAVTVRPADGLDPSVLAGHPDFATLDGKKKIQAIGVDFTDTKLVCCSPFFLAKKDVPFLLDYVKYHERADVLPDSIGSFFGALAEDAVVRPVLVGDCRYRDTGTVDGYEHAKGLYAKPENATAPKRGPKLKEVINGKR